MKKVLIWGLGCTIVLAIVAQPAEAKSGGHGKGRNSSRSSSSSHSAPSTPKHSWFSPKTKTPATRTPEKPHMQAQAAKPRKGLMPHRELKPQVATVQPKQTTRTITRYATSQPYSTHRHKGLFSGQSMFNAFLLYEMLKPSLSHAAPERHDNPSLYNYDTSSWYVEQPYTPPPGIAQPKATRQMQPVSRIAKTDARPLYTDCSLPNSQYAFDCQPQNAQDEPPPLNYTPFLYTRKLYEN